MASDPAIPAALLVAMGAVPGSWLRYRIVNHLEPRVPRRHWGTFAVNVFACFSLGVLVGLAGRWGSQGAAVLALLGTGFLGSLSTFSTFLAEVLTALREGERQEALLLTAGSVAAGMAALTTGLRLGA